MGRARNPANDFVPVPASIIELAGELLAMEPTVLLMIGPQGVSILKKLRAHQPVRVVELVALHNAILAAGRRASKMRGKLSKAQRDQIAHAIRETETLEGLIILVSLPPEELERLLRERGRIENPTRTIVLEPLDQKSLVLAERVVGIYDPVFAWEPKAVARREDGTLRIEVTGTTDLADNLVELIFETLGANRYQGIWQDDGRHRVIAGARASNRKRALLR